MSLTEQTTTVEITIAGDTRTVESHTYASLDETHAIHVNGVVATIGRGTARYPDTLTLHRLRAGDRPRPGTTKVTDSEGREWTYHTQTCVRNRQARIVGWADAAGVTNAVDQTRIA